MAAAGAWFGGWVDGLIQRISEINMVLPLLPTSILVFFLYSKSFWVILVPSYIFFESTLSFLGVSDPFLPTLGKQLVAALQGGLYGRPVFLLLEPVGMLVLIAVGFALLGFALERLFNEKLGI